MACHTLANACRTPLVLAKVKPLNCFLLLLLRAKFRCVMTHFTMRVQSRYRVSKSEPDAKIISMLEVTTCQVFGIPLYMTCESVCVYTHLHVHA